jgi:twitching motility protein PilT
MANELSDLLQNEKDLTRIHDILSAFEKSKASDLHLISGEVPYITIYTKTIPLEGFLPISNKDIKQMLWSIVTPKQWDYFKKNKSLDASYYLESIKMRFRLHYFYEEDKPSAVLRSIPDKVKPLSDWGLPNAVNKLAYLPNGLVLVSGAVGSGKSTTTAGLIKEINDNRHANIITIESPIEFKHTNNKSIIRQREVGRDTPSFTDALRDALRAAPDVIFIGELRDPETIKIAIKASEVGRLVIGTLHTSSVSETIDRIMLEFSPDEQKQIRASFLSSLQGIVCQTMLPKVGGGMQVALEIMRVTPKMRELFISKRGFAGVNGIIKQTSKLGNVLLDDSLVGLAKAKKIEKTVAIAAAKDAEYVAGRLG